MEGTKFRKKCIDNRNNGRNGCITTLEGTQRLLLTGIIIAPIGLLDPRPAGFAAGSNFDFSIKIEKLNQRNSRL